MFEDPEVLIIVCDDVAADPDTYCHTFESYPEALRRAEEYRSWGFGSTPIAHGIRFVTGTSSFVDFVDWAAYQADVDRLARRGVTR